MERTKAKGKIIVAISVFLCCSVLLCSGEAGRPQRLVSLGPSITKQLYLLGLGDKLVGCTVYCEWPIEARRKEKIGTAVEVNLEKVVSLKPDIIFATSLTDPKAIEKLENLGLKTIRFPTPRSFAQICAHFLELGRLTDRQKEAEKIIESVKNEVNMIKQELKGKPKPRVLIQVGAKPLFVATGRYFVNDFVELAGGINIAKDAGEGIYSREQVLEKNPEVIIIVTMGIVK